LGVYQRR